MRSIFTVTPLVSPHFFAQPSRYVSKSGTKWLHWRMFRLPLSFGRVPTPVAPVAPLGDALAPPPGPPACCPIHEARTGAAAAAAAPLRSVRRLMPSVVRSLVTSTSRTCSRESIPAAGAKRNNVSAIRKPAAAGGYGFWTAIESAEEASPSVVVGRPVRASRTATLLPSAARA